MPQVVTYHVLQGYVADSLSGLRVRSGRPDIESLLHQAVARHEGVARIGVFAAGPASMIRDVKCGCASYNAAWKKPHLNFTSHAFEL